MSSMLRSADYDVAVQALIRDGSVHRMLPGIMDAPLADLAHEDGTPRFGFMTAANAQYEKLAGHAPQAHLGAVAEALLALRAFVVETAEAIRAARKED